MPGKNQFKYKESYRRHLPHIQPPGATMFITFRLAGSIPQNILDTLFEERQKAERDLEHIANQRERARRIDLEERKFFSKWDKALDTASNGPYWLRDEKIESQG